ncbi:MAG: sulfatase [Planctomycetia bacterium]|nr:sulfatase [Planctomycetia bacterium]
MRYRSYVVIGLCLAGAAFSPIEVRAENRRPNILFIFSDDHAAQAVGCYGSKINQTPNLDRIARQGMRFTNCFCTNALCGPSRAVVMTGKYSHLNGFLKNGDVFDGSQPTMPKLLRQAGYQTAVVGKWHLESDPVGFDYWNVLIGQGPYYNPPMIENGKRIRHTGYTTDIITDITLDFLKNRRQADKPFLVMYQHKAPHREWQPDPRHFTLYREMTIPEPANLFDDYAGRGSPARNQEMTIARHMNELDLKLKAPANLNPDQLAAWQAAYKEENDALAGANLQGNELVRWKYQRYMKDYLRCIAAVNDNVGRVLDYLEESGLAENTIVIYSSDQGFFLGEHGWFDKRFMYEESLRMPLMIRWPGKVKPGSVSSDFVSNLDFAETLLEAAGVSVPADMQGRSLVSVLEGRTPADWRKTHYYQYYEFPAVHSVPRHYGVRTARHKLIHFYQLGEWELFDLEQDPHEMQSVYDDPKNADIVRELKTELERMRKQYQVPEDRAK